MSENNEILKSSAPPERQLVSFDWAIKKLLRSKANFKILEGFLSVLLKEDVFILEILESEANQEEENDKYNRVDLLVKNKNEEIIIIEVQYDYEYDFMLRMLYGTSKIISERMKKTKPYSEVKKVISINIVYFDLGQGSDYVYKGTTNFIGMHKNDTLELSNVQKKKLKKDKIFKLYPEYYLLKINNFNDLAKDSLDEWIYFLKNEKIEKEFKAKGLEEAKETLDIMKLSEEDRISYKHHFERSIYAASMAESVKIEKEEKAWKSGEKAGIEKGIEKGIERGIEKGIKKGIEKEKLNSEKRIKENKIEIAKNLLDVLDDDTISKKTNLSIKEIKKLRKEFF